MKTNIWCTILLILSVFSPIFSQNAIIDSLENELQNYKPKDSIRVKLLNDLAFIYSRKDSSKTMAYITESEKISNAISFKKGVGKALYLKGVTKAFHSGFTEGFQYYNEALVLYKTIVFKEGVAECYNGMGTFFFYKNDYEQSIKFYKKSSKINKEIGNTIKLSTDLLYIGISHGRLGHSDSAIAFYRKSLNLDAKHNKKGMSRSLSHIGSIYVYQGQYHLAQDFFNNSLLISKKYGDSIGISASLNNLGIIYYSMRNYDKAIIFYENALTYQKQKDNNKKIAEISNNLGLVYKDKKNFKLANNYLKEALSIYKNEKDKTYKARCLNNIGDVYLGLKDNETAFEYFKRAKKNGLEVNDKLGLCKSYFGIATVYTDQKKYTNALNNALKSKTLSDELELINYQSDIFKLLSEIYEATEDFKRSLEYLALHKKFNDSIFNKENIEKLTQLEYEYKYKQKLDSANTKALTLTKTVKKASQNLKESQQHYLWTIIAFLLVSILLGGIIFYLKFRNIKSKTQNIVIEQKLLRSQMTPHFIFNSLSVLQGMILNKEEKKSVSYLSKFSKLLRIILENSRDKTVSLTQEIAAIENYLSLQTLADKSYQYRVHIEESLDLSQFEIPAMLIQPFAENAIEHAFPNQKENKSIEIHLTFLNEKLTCTISDNGIGVNFLKKNKRTNKKSLATTITSERLKILSKDFKINGEVVIEDRQKYGEQGTVVTLVIPYKLHAKQLTESCDLQNLNK